MRVHAKRNAKAAGKLLFYIPAADITTGRMTREDFDEMRAMPNISTSSKFYGILLVFVGMEMIFSQ